MYTNGGNGNGNGNGSKRTKLTLSDLKGGASDVATADEDFPELLNEREGTSSERTTTSAKRENTDSAEDIDEEDVGVELLEKDEKRGTLKRVVVALGVAACALLVIAVAGYLWLFSGSRDDTYRVRNPASRNRAEAGAINDNSPQMPTAEEIARELNKGGNSNSAANTNQGVMPDAATNNNLSLNGNSPVTDRLPLGDFSATVTPQPNAGTLQGTATQNATGQTTQVDSTQRATTNREAIVTSAGSELGSPNPERSIRVSALLANNGGNARVAGSENLSVSTPTQAERTTQSVPLPPLGTMLPVRTLGAVYTLRSEGYVRMQLTRAMSGQGWSLPRGTEIYGVVRGSDFEIGRAYIQLVGFIDQASGKLVRNSGWSRALKIAGAGVVQALYTVAATVGNRPVNAGESYGYSAPHMASPLMREINGLAYRQGRAGFVEVPANTAGYIFVMTSPREIQGVDAGDVNTDELRRMSDTGQARAGGQLSEAELVELMTNGNPDDIRRALPRMTPEMRRVAEAVLAEQ
ncbi:MAG: hypothetical protein DMF64_21430 [Acidobacteria bacterium]|nr:MAG: hypothetical protein DMF64_21430 [Acidobacteriota bacterium]